VAWDAVIPGSTPMDAPATPDQKQGTRSGFAGGKSQFSFCGGRWDVVA